MPPTGPQTFQLAASGAGLTVLSAPEGGGHIRLNSTSADAIPVQSGDVLRIPFTALYLDRRANPLFSGEYKLLVWSTADAVAQVTPAYRQPAVGQWQGREQALRADPRGRLVLGRNVEDVAVLSNVPVAANEVRRSGWVWMDYRATPPEVEGWTESVEDGRLPIGSPYPADAHLRQTGFQHVGVHVFSPSGASPTFGLSMEYSFDGAGIHGSLALVSSGSRFAYTHATTLRVVAPFMRIVILNGSAAANYGCYFRLITGG